MARNPHFTSVAPSPKQARDLLEALGGNEPPGFADEFDGRSFREVYENRETTREALAYFGIHVSEDSLPKVIGWPEPASVEEALVEVDEGRVEPHVGFRQPWCIDRPPYSLTFAFVLSSAFQRAEQRPPGA